MNNGVEHIDFQLLYDQDLFNRHYLYKNVNYIPEKRYGVKLFLMNLLLLAKLFASRFIKHNGNIGKSLFISWSPLHTSRAKDFPEEYTLIEFQRSSFSRKQLSYFSKVSMVRLIRILLKLKRSKISEAQKSSPYTNNTLFYRFLFLVDFFVLNGICGGTDKIAMAGYNDRVSLIISIICERNQIHLSMLQHGVLGKKEHWMHLKAQKFYYLYPFSKSYVKHQIVVTPETELIYLPKKKSSANLKLFEGGNFDKNIAYATSPADSQKDVIILSALKEEVFKKEYNLLIYPHPLENENMYEVFKDDKSVFVTRERHENLKYLVSRYSTLGIDYHEKGIVPIFLNVDRHDIDFLNSHNFKVFDSITSFMDWFETNT